MNMQAGWLHSIEQQLNLISGKLLKMIEK